jgi:peptidoglycan/LPS O-acetylase OafA/YrhL
MLQRIQSLLLAIAAIAMIAFLFLPVWVKTGTDEQASIDAFNFIHTKGTLSQVTPVYYLGLLAIFSSIIAVFAIFQYKNRVKQMLFVALNSLISAVLMVSTVYIAQFNANKLFEVDKTGSYKIGIGMVAISLVCSGIANRFIRRDEKLVKDADRMR